MVSTAKTSPASDSKLNVLIREPSPTLAPTNSATSAPVNARVSEVLRPANTNGSADGHASLRNVCRRDATSERMNSKLFSSTLASPTTVLMTTGKNAMVAAITIFEVNPKPNQVMNSGARMTFGVICNATTYG